MTKVDNSVTLPIMSTHLSTQIEGFEDGGGRTRTWLSRYYRKKRTACKCFSSATFKWVSNHDIGSAGCSANWKSCGTASHQASGVFYRSCLTAWTRHTSAY